MSKIYIYKNLEKVSTNYHSGGGAVIVTNREPQTAWAAYFEEQAIGSNYEHDELLRLSKHKLPEPDRIIESNEPQEENVYIFEDSGCC